MDENITHALSMVGSVILFIFALSCAIYSYESLEHRLEFFFDVHSITARKEDATSQLVDESKIQRKVKFAEVFMGIIDLPQYVSTAGNSSVSEIQIVHGEDEANFSVVIQTDPTTLEEKKYICINSDNSMMYDVNISEDLNELTEWIIVYALAEDIDITNTQNSNLALGIASDAIRDTTFSVTYDNDTIIYTANV